MRRPGRPFAELFDEGVAPVVVLLFYEVFMYWLAFLFMSGFVYLLILMGMAA